MLLAGGSGVRFPAGERSFSSPNVHTESGAPTVSCSVSAVVWSGGGGKRLGFVLTTHIHLAPRLGMTVDMFTHSVCLHNTDWNKFTFFALPSTARSP
jgi:hypothetical protein